LMCLSLFSSSIFHTSGGENNSAVVRSNGTMRYPQNGTNNGDASYYGFVIPSNNFFSSSYKWTTANFQKIKDYGFNTIGVEFWWGNFENLDGSWNTARINAVKSQVASAIGAGLQVVMLLRVCHDPPSANVVEWWQWSGTKYPTHDYVNLNQYWGGEYGRTRYVHFVTYMSGQFSNCMICPWQMPYHKQSCPVLGSSWNTYKNTTAPALLQAIRDGGNTNPIWYVPIHQSENGRAFIEGEQQAYTGYGTIVYCFGHGSDSRTEYNDPTPSNWRTILDSRYSELITWHQAHPTLAMASVEYFPMSWYSSSDLTETRMEVLNYSLDKCLEGKLGWCYYWCSKSEPKNNVNILSDPSEFIFQEKLISALRAHLP